MKIANHLAALQPSYIREILAAAANPGMISLAGGLPAEQSFPMDLMAEAIESLVGNPGLFQYGETAGYEPLRVHLRERFELAKDDDLVVCTGSQQALDLVARAFLNPGDQVVVESPSYLGALQVFAIAQADVQGVDQTEDGPDLDQLEALFKTGKVKLFYAVPDFHNPTGVSWGFETRLQVAELCTKYAVTLLEDCPYRDIRFSGEMLPLVSTFCPEISIVLRSFSKTVSPGMRFGIASGPAQWISAMVRVKQGADLHSNIPMQAVLLAALEHQGFTAHIRKVCNMYHSRYLALAKQIGEQMENSYFNAVDGGMFVWLCTPGSDTYEVATKAIERGVAIVPGKVFYHTIDTSSDCMRLNFSNTSEDDFAIAIRRLKSCL